MAAWKLSAAALCLLVLLNVAAPGCARELLDVLPEPEPEPEPEPCVPDEVPPSVVGPTGATYYYSKCAVDGRAARQVCLDLGAQLSLPLSLANVPQRDNIAVAKLIYDAAGFQAAYINTAQFYETPFDIPGRPFAGPVGRNCLSFKPTKADGGAYETDPPPFRPTKQGVCEENPRDLPVVCKRAAPVEQPVLCTLENTDPEYLGWGITFGTSGPNKLADANCPPGYMLGNVELNNLYKGVDQTRYNSNNPHDFSGWPFLPALVAKCAPGKRVWANTAPYFTTSGLCVSINEVQSGPKNTGGQPTGAREKRLGGKGTDDPLCTQVLQALCFNPTP